MKIKIQIVLIALVFVNLSSCCSGEGSCYYREAEILIIIKNHRADANAYWISRTDKNFVNIETIKMTFSDRYTDLAFLLDKYTFNYKSNELLKDFNYIIKNSNTGKRDTISNITYTVTIRSNECVTCFPKSIKTTEYFQEASNFKLSFTGEIDPDIEPNKAVLTIN